MQKGTCLEVESDVDLAGLLVFEGDFHHDVGALLVLVVF